MSLDALTTIFLKPIRMNGTWRQVNISWGLWYKNSFVLGSGRDVFFSKLPLTHQKNSLLPTSCWFWMTFSPQNGFGHPNAIGSVHELLHQIVAGRDGILVIEPGRYAVAPSSLVNKKVPCWKKGDVNELFCWLATFLAQNTKILFWLCRLFFLPPWNKQYSQISFEFVFLQKRFCPLQTPWSSHHWLSPSSWGLPTGEVNFKSTQKIPCLRSDVFLRFLPDWDSKKLKPILHVRYESYIHVLGADFWK